MDLTFGSKNHYQAHRIVQKKGVKKYRVGAGVEDAFLRAGSSRASLRQAGTP